MTIYNGGMEVATLAACFALEEPPAWATGTRGSAHARELPGAERGPRMADCLSISVSLF